MNQVDLPIMFSSVETVERGGGNGMLKDNLVIMAQPKYPKRALNFKDFSGLGNRYGSRIGA